MRAEDQVFNFETSIPRDAVGDIVIVAINISDEEICCSYFLLRFLFLILPSHFSSLLAPGTTFLVFQCHRCWSLSSELQTLSADGVNVGVVDNVADVAN